MFGYTEDELETYFGEYIEALNKQGIYDENRNKLDYASILTTLKRWYDGFRFSPREESVYNPVSIGSFFRNEGIFSNYWFETGTPKVLIKTMQQIQITLDDVRDPIISRDTFSVFDITEFAFSSDGIKNGNARRIIGKQKFLQLLYQTGYMTLGDVPEDGLSDSYYPMRFPNKEVRDSFKNMKNYILIKAEEKGQTIHKIGVEFSYNKDQRNIIEWVEV